MNDEKCVISLVATLIGLIALTIALAVLANVIGDNFEQEMIDKGIHVEKGAYTSQRTEPVGHMQIADPDSVVTTPTSETAQATVSGEQVYNAGCFACHGSGVAGAPKLGDKEDWAKRLGNGLETLVEHAIFGYTGDVGFMPAKGGFANLSDEEVRAAVNYMVEQSQ